jgi:hypothetical protein
VHALLHFFGLDNASGVAYLAWSGIIGDAGLFAAVAAFVFHGTVSYRHKQCEVHRCVRVGRHVTAANHRVCRKHSPTGAPTHAEVIAAHHAAEGGHGRHAAVNATPGGNPA